jgi:oxygen-dependent protoporphyrinogen oxidase
LTPTGGHPHIVIVGGGITGLAAAYALVTDPRVDRLGLRCTIVEAEPVLGGKLQTEQIDGCLVENGPDSFLATKPWAADLCRKVGLGDRLVGTLPGRTVYVAYRGRLHPLPEGMAFGVPTRLWPLVRSRLLSPAEKLRAATDLLLPRRDGTGDETIGSLLRRRLGGAVVDRLAGPLLGGIYAGDPDQLSVRATFPMLAEWEASHRSLILAALARRRRSRGVLAAGGASPMFLSLIGGVSELVHRLQSLLGGVLILTGRTVAWLQRRPGGYHLGLDDGTMLEASAVLLAVPAYVAAGLLERLAPEASRLLRAIPYVSTAAVTLGYRRADLDHPLDGHGFVVARGERLAMTGCTWLSSKWPHRAPPDRALLRCYLGAAGRDAVVDAEDSRLVAMARADLRATMGVDAEPLFVSVARWKRAMPQYLPGHLDRLADIEADLSRLPDLAIAGAGYRGIGIPDCIRQGTEAAGRLAAHLARQPALL